MAHYRANRKDMNAIDDPQHPHTMCGKCGAKHYKGLCACPKPLPVGHPQREPMRPRGAGSITRDRMGRARLHGFGITDENAHEVYRRIWSDDADLMEPPRDMVGELAHRVRNLSAVHKLALIAVIVAGSCAFVVGVAYGWGVFW